MKKSVAIPKKNPDDAHRDFTVNKSATDLYSQFKISWMYV